MTSNASKERAKARRAALILAIAMLAPLLLGVDRLWTMPTSRATQWALDIDAAARRAAKRITTPKVLVVGGSSVAFGLRPASLSARIGLPVVVFGINAGVGLDLIAARAATLISPGDLVVVSPELNHFQHRRPIDNALRADWARGIGLPLDEPSARFPRRQWIAARGRAQHILDIVDNTFVDASKSLAGVVVPHPKSPYEADSIDDHAAVRFSRPGVVSWLTVQRPDTRPEQFDLKNSAGMQSLRILRERCTSIGATLVIMPAIRCDHSSFTPEQRAGQLDRQRDILNAAATLGVPALLPPEATFMPADAAYDTTYHLNDAGVAQLEPVLSAAIADRMSSSSTRATSR